MEKEDHSGSRSIARRLCLPLILAAAVTTAGPPVYCRDRDGTVMIPSNRARPARVMTIGLNKLAIIDLKEDVSEVVISNPAVIEAIVRTERRVHLLGQRIGQASATFIGRDGAAVLTLDVAVERDLAPAEAAIRRAVPGARVHLEMLNDNVLITGTAATPLDATRVADIAARFVPKREQVLNMLDVEAKEQVLLRVRVAEMNRSALRRLGVDLQGALSAGNVSVVKIAETAFPITGGMVTAAALGSSVRQVSGSALGVGVNRKNGSAAALVQALEREGLARTLAEPNLTAVSGETANFLAGGEYPVPVGGSETEGTTIQFKSFGVSLGFTPVVLSGGRISLKIATEMSELTSDGAVTVNTISVPALKVRRASSTLELPSGGSMVMAGLLSQQTRMSAEGLPGLKRLPVLGALFRSDDFVRQESELVVIVTPYLVRPAGGGILRQPGGERALQYQAAVNAGLVPGPGHESATKQAGTPDTADGDFGFIVE